MVGRISEVRRHPKKYSSGLSGSCHPNDISSLPLYYINERNSLTACVQVHALDTPSPWHRDAPRVQTSGAPGLSADGGETRVLGRWRWR